MRMHHARPVAERATGRRHDPVTGVFWAISGAMCASVARRSVRWIGYFGTRKLTFMTTGKMQTGQFFDRARRCAREIGLAVALTLAGVMFLLTTLHSSGSKQEASITPPQAGVENHAN